MRSAAIVQGEDHYNREGPDSVECGKSRFEIYRCKLTRGGGHWVSISI